MFLDKAKSIQLLNSALNGCNIKSLMETVMQNSSFLGFNETTASNVRTNLIHFEVSQGSLKPTFASSYIRDELLNVSETEFHGFYSEFSKSHGAKSFAAAVRGTLYEKCVLDYLSCLELNLPSFCIQSKQSRKVICLPKLTAMHYCTLEDINTSLINILWIPITSNFKSFDCLIQLEFLSLWIQITVGEVHPLAATGVNDCFNRTGAERSRIVFCLPPDVFQAWERKDSKQTFTTKEGKVSKIHDNLEKLPQYVACLGGDSIETGTCHSLLKDIINVEFF